MNANLKMCLKLIGAFVVIMALMIVAAMWLSGCNPAARLARKQAQAVSTVLANNDLVNSVGVEWSKNHPCANDTTILNFGRDTVTSFLHDTLLDGYTYRDTVYKTVNINTLKTVRIHDTLNRYIVDSRAVNSLTDSINHYRELNAASGGQILQQQQVINQANASTNHWKWSAWITWILLFVGTCLGVYFKKL